MITSTGRYSNNGMSETGQLTGSKVSETGEYLSGGSFVFVASGGVIAGGSAEWLPAAFMIASGGALVGGMSSISAVVQDTRYFTVTQQFGGFTYSDVTKRFTCVEA